MQHLSGSLLRRNIYQVSLNTDLITLLFRVLFKNWQPRQRYWPLFQVIILLCSSLFHKGKDYFRDKAFWKFNSFLTKEQNYITEIKKLIGSFCTKEKFFFNVQLKWEFIKYELRKFNVNYTKHITKEKRQQQTNLENQLKMLEKSLDEDDNLFKYYAIDLEWSMN